MKRDDLKIEEPCNKSWEKMHGDDITRFCDGCHKNVHNLSGMTARDAEAFLQAEGSGVCVVYQFDAQRSGLRFVDGPVHERAVPMAQLLGAKRLVAAASLAVPLLMSVGCETESCSTEQVRPIDFIIAQETALIDAMSSLLGVGDHETIDEPLMGEPVIDRQEPGTTIEVRPQRPPPKVEHQIRDQLDTQVEPNQPPARLVMGRIAPTRLSETVSEP